MSVDFDYYFKANGNYDDVVDRGTLTQNIQKTMNEDLNDNLITEFNVKMGMDYYRETVLVNFERELDCILKFKRLKEALINSRARELLCEVGGVKTGDYITHVNKKKPSDIRTYIVRNMIDTKHTNDSSLILLTDHKFVIKADDGSLMDVYCGGNDNKTMLKESDVGTSTKDTSSMWVFLQDNINTRKLGQEITRILIDGDAYKTIGRGDRVTDKGIITLAITHDVIDVKDDLETGLAYNEYYDNPTEPPDVTDEIQGEDELQLKWADEWTIENPDDEPCIWSVDADFIVIQAFDNHSVTLKCQDKTSNRGKTFTLKAEYGAVILTKIIEVI